MDSIKKNDILNKLRTRANTDLDLDVRKLKRKDMEILSYKKWAMDEILCAIETSDSAPTTAVERFAALIDHYACQKHPSSYIFSIAYDMAIWVLDILITPGKEGIDESIKRF